MNKEYTKTFEKFPILHTERLDLVEIKQHHLSDIFKLFGNDQVTKYYNIKTLKEEKDAQKYLDWFTSRFNDKLGIRWGISIKDQSGIIGTVGFNNFTKGHRANLGYDLKLDFWNKGYIKEALKTVMKFGFEQLEINRIEAEIMPGNIYSEKALVSLGFEKEGLLRDWMLWEGKYYDMIMYSKLSNSLKQSTKANKIYKKYE